MMTTSRPFTFILHVINKNQDITGMTITGIASRSKEPCIKVEHINFSVTQISFDKDGIDDISSLVDMEQVSNACFNFVAELFAEDISIENELRNFPVSTKLFIPAIAS